MLKLPKNGTLYIQLYLYLCIIINNLCTKVTCTSCTNFRYLNEFPLIWFHLSCNKILNPNRNDLSTYFRFTRHLKKSHYKIQIKHGKFTPWSPEIDNRRTSNEIKHQSNGIFRTYLKSFNRRTSVSSLPMMNPCAG